MPVSYGRDHQSVVHEKLFRLKFGVSAHQSAPGRGSSASADVAKPDVPAAAIPPVAATSPAADDRLTAQERAARVRALKEGLAKTEIPIEAPEHNR